MSAEDLEKYETEMELQLYREYRDVVGIFTYVVETDRRFYLCNQVDVKARTGWPIVEAVVSYRCAAWRMLGSSSPPASIPAATLSAMSLLTWRYRAMSGMLPPGVAVRSRLAPIGPGGC